MEKNISGSMKIITIIGTRPQYIKLKPLQDYLKNTDIENITVDTGQHFSDNVSKIFINELDIKIDHYLNTDNQNQFSFMSDAIKKLSDIYDVEKPDLVLVLGDTNSTLMAALVANKKYIKLGHIEAGIRIGQRTRPEEINRILVDNLSDIHFISRQSDRNNVNNPVFVGDLEYTLLRNIEEKTKFTTSYEDWILMTIHRQENTAPNRLRDIFQLCVKSPFNIIFPVHHRTLSVIRRYDIIIPNNINIMEPVGYYTMIDMLSRCKAIISDSGGIIKISPYFGKKCLIPLSITEWQEVVNEGYGYMNIDFDFIKEYKVSRNRDFYYLSDCCDKIYRSIEDI